MTAVWDLDLPASEKLVLLALADWSNDEGLCWPSIATLAKKCSKSERTLQRAIAVLTEKDLIAREERPGKGVLYQLLPRQAVTPDKMSPPTKATKTPDNLSSNPRQNVTQYLKTPKDTARAQGAHGGLGKVPAPAARPASPPSPVPERSLEAHRELLVRQAIERACGGQELPWLARAGIKCSDIDGQDVGLTLIVPAGQKDHVEQQSGWVMEIANRDTSLAVRWVKVEQTRALRAA